jgi:oxygen-dependent protoporphyrinogen oxidase
VAGIRGGVHRLVDALAADLGRRGVDVRLGSRVERGELGSLDGTVVLAAPGLAAAPVAGRAITLVTLVVDQRELDAFPRGPGLLVAESAATVEARALTHLTAKWTWLRERAAGLHILRLSYDGVQNEDVRARAHTDAELLLGVPLPRVIDTARVVWSRPAPENSGPDVVLVGETAAGSGLAGVIAHAERTAQRVIRFPDAMARG